MSNHHHYPKGYWDEGLVRTWVSAVSCYPLLFLIIIVFSSLQTHVFAQSSMVLYNMRHIPQSNQLNPGQMPYMKLHIGMPVLSSIRLGLGTTAFDYEGINDQIEAEEATYGTIISPSAPEFNRGVVDFELQLLNFGFQFNKGKSYLNFDVSDAFYASGNFTRDFASMFDQIENNQLQNAGSMTFDQSQQALNMAYYRSYSVGYTQQVNSKLSLGLRARYLQGILNLWSENQGLQFHYPGDGSSFEVEGRLNLLTAGRGLLDGVDGVSSFFPADNSGFAFDIGGLYQINDKWELSFAMQQLGQITWKNDVNYTVVGDQLTFSAVDIDDHMDTWSAVADSLLNGEGINTRVSYTTPLPQRYFIGANYFFSPNSSVGVLINPVHYYQATDLNLAISVQTRLGKIFGVSAVFGHNRYADLSVGTGVSIELGFFQVYALTEALFSSTSWRSAQMGHGQLGINLNFGRYKRSDLVRPKEREVMTDIALVEPSSSSEPLPEILEEQAIEEDPLPLIPVEESPPKLSSEEMVPNSLESEVEKLDHVSPNYYLFSGALADRQSGLRVERAKYEIYTISADGRQELFLIGSVMDGKLSVQLAVDKLHVVQLIAQGYQEQEVTLEKVGFQQSQTQIQKGIQLIPRPPVTSVQTEAEESSPVPSPKQKPEVKKETTPPARAVIPTPRPSRKVEVPATPPATPIKELPQFRLSKSTSLRKGPTHTSGVILRLRTDDRVELLEKTTNLWWKIKFGQEVGFAKALLMEEL